MQRITIIISANSEWHSIKGLFPGAVLKKIPFGEYFSLLFKSLPVTFFQGGWGKISAAATTQYAIDHFQPDLLVNLGTCGGFEGRIAAGALILVEKTIVYDIVEQMSDPVEAIEFYSTPIDLSWLPDHPAITSKKGLLVSADRDIVIQEIPALVEKFGARAADWESGAIAWVAAKNQTRLLILRGITDLVGSNGGEAYGRIDLFHERTEVMMAELVRWFGLILELMNQNQSS